MMHTRVTCIRTFVSVRSLSSSTIKSVNLDLLESSCFLSLRSTVLVSLLTCLRNLHFSLCHLFIFGRPNGALLASSRRFLFDCSSLAVLCNGNVLLLPAHILPVSLLKDKPLGLVSVSTSLL